jgi:hypothetical protein
MVPKVPVVGGVMKWCFEHRDGSQESAGRPEFSFSLTIPPDCQALKIIRTRPQIGSGRERLE